MRLTKVLIRCKIERYDIVYASFKEIGKREILFHFPANNNGDTKIYEANFHEKKH